MKAEPSPDEMMQLLKAIQYEHQVHGKLISTKVKLDTFIQLHTGEPDPDCIHDEIVVVTKYKWGAKLGHSDRVVSYTYCKLCKIKID